MTVVEIQVIQSEIASIKERLDKHDESQKRVWERIDQQAKDMVRIQVLMENVEKTMGEVKVTLATINSNQTKSENKWTVFFEKWFWLLIGAAITLLTKTHLGG